MNKTIGIVIGAVLIAGAAFAGGYFLSGTLGGNAAGPGARGGAFAQLTEDERAQMQNMTDEERQAFFEEKGIDMPTGGPGQGAGAGAGGAGGPGGAGGTKLLEGVVASADTEKITVTLSAGGSANAYLDDSTVIASVSAGAASIEKGANVTVVTQSEAAGVDAARVVVLK